MKSPSNKMSPASSLEPSLNSSPVTLEALWRKKEAELMAAKASDAEIFKAKDKLVAEYRKAHPEAFTLAAVDQGG